MNINYDFYYIKSQNNQKIVLTLDNGKTHAGHFEINDNIEPTQNDRKKLTFKQLQMSVDKVAYHNFIEQTLSLQSFKDSSSCLNPIRIKLQEMVALEDIGNFINSWYLLFKKKHQFQKLKPFEMEQSNSKYFNEHEKKDLFGDRIKKIQLAFDLILSCEKLHETVQENQALLEQVKNIKDSVEGWIRTDQVKLCSEMTDDLQAGIERLSKKQEISFYDVREICLLKNYYNECQTIFNITYEKLKYADRSAYRKFQPLLEPLHSLFAKIKKASLTQCSKEASNIGLARLLTVADTINAIKSRYSVSKPRKIVSALPSFMLNNSFLKILPIYTRIEEKSILGRFAFGHESSVVPAYHFKNLQLDQLRISLDCVIPSYRRFPIKKLTTEQQNCLAQKLYDQPSRNLWHKVNVNNKSTLDLQRKCFEFFSNRSFKVRLGEEILPFSLENLLTYHEYEKIPADLEIAFEDGIFHKKDDFFANFKAKDEHHVEHAFKDARSFFYQIDPNRQSFFSLYIPDKETDFLVSTCEKQMWGYLNHDNEWTNITFQKLYHNVWIDQTITKNTQLRVIEPTHQTECHAFFSILMQEIDKEQVIKQCELQQWEYRVNEKWIRVTFQQLFKMWLDGTVPATTYIRSFQSFKVEDNKFQLLNVLNLPTIFIVPELTQTYITQEIGPIHKICGKTKLNHLWTFDQIKTKSPAFDNITQRLNDRSMVKAFLVLLHQFLDFHGGNLGVVPLNNSYFHEMNQHQYFLRKGSEWSRQSLFDLIKLFLSNELDDRTFIGLIKTDEPQKFYTVEIGNYPQLKSVLNDTQWEIQIFDGDQVLSESEMIGFISNWDKNKTPHRSLVSMIPLHNFLLNLTNFKNAPLSDEFLMEIQKILSDTRLLQWSLNKHSFAWQFINQKHHHNLEKIILEKMLKPEFTLGYYASQNLPIDPYILRRTIAKDLADLSKHTDLWAHIQNIIDPSWFKPHVITAEDMVPYQMQIEGLEDIEFGKPQETLKKLAALYNLNLEELIKLNVDKMGSLAIGTQLQVKTSFTLDTPGAQKQREIFVKALLPLNSVKQLISQQKRVTNCARYLDFYKQLCLLKNEHNPAAIAKTISAILTDAVYPFTTEHKDQLLQRILKDEIFLFLKEILKEYASLKKQPSKKQKIAQTQNSSTVYKKLSQLKREQNPVTVLEAILEIFSNPTISIDTRNKILGKTHVLLKSMQEQALLILPEVVQAYIPTYEKLAFVMYPLLADSRQLNLFSLGQRVQTKEYDFAVGCLVGHFENSLERIIFSATEKFKNDPKTLSVIQQIVARIENEKNKQKNDSLNIAYYMPSKKNN